MALREYWVNVYKRAHGGQSLGREFTREDRAVIAGMIAHASYRIHVRLKPLGAPARYSSERNRQQWETMPEEMRKCPF